MDLQNHRYPYLCSSDGLIELIYKLENQLGIIQVIQFIMDEFLSLFYQIE
jgi:hypothetical protein